MPRSKRFRRARLFVLVLVVLLIAGTAGAGFFAVHTVRSSFPVVEGSVKVAGMTAPVDVKRDANGIPQLYADSSEDLFRAQGYVQAQDRFWEMDVRRHITAGRLSEMFGSGQVETDSFLRTMGWRRVAQEEYDSKLAEDTKKYLQAYSDGVNAWLSEHSGSSASLEYGLLGAVNGDYKPEPWNPVDSVAWLKAMAWNLSGNMQEEIDRSLLAQDFGPEKIDQLYPAYPYERNGTIVTGAVGTDGAFRPSGGSATAAQGTASTVQGRAATESLLKGVADRIGAVPQLLGRQGQGIGSNSWVVSGEHTTTRKPLMANDPHLGPSMPSTWYQMGLHCRNVGAACQFDTAGFTFAGLPGVVIGHNQNISWGFTNLGADVTDLYLEKVTSPDTYLVDGKQKNFETRKETIKVAGGEDRTIVVRTTDRGPLISDKSTEEQNVGKYAPADNAPDRAAGYGVALQWTALIPGKTMDAVFKLDRAADWDGFRAAAADFAVPAQNLIYADTKGNIGYQAPGMIPQRTKGDGRYPAPGWDSSYGWNKEFLPFKALPYSWNPVSGYIVTANQAVVDPNSYKPLLTKDWEYGTRAKEIETQITDRLKNGGKISPDDMRDIQLDNTSVMARTLVPLLLKVRIDDPYVREAQDLLKDWNFHQDADSAAAAYYNAVWRQLLTLAFGQKFPADLRAEGDCLLVRQKRDSTLPDDDLNPAPPVTVCGTRDPGQAQPDGGDRWTEVVRGLLTQPESPWWEYKDANHQAQKGLGNLLAESLKNARQELTAKLGKDIATWSWGRLHTLTLTEQTLGKDDSSIASGLVHKLLNRGPYQLSGGTAAVNAAGWNAAAGYQVDWVPSMRMVVDLSDFNASRWINVGGASGHAFHENYNDQTELWVKGELLPWAWSPEAVEQATRHKLVLTRG
ncbi:penicillin acylase family protein [Kitasatospora sp. NPDC002040]|uniref:penicillin acylase family protein n=1 Tax=Kitasatospora sp. NPDC002040 TaxID=3154661 RepID=UPI00332F2102